MTKSFWWGRDDVNLQHVGTSRASHSRAALIPWELIGLWLEDVRLSVVMNILFDI